MGIVIVLVGRPGSGKSCAAHRIVDLGQQKGLSVVRINDYKILYELYKADQVKDKAHRQFSPIEHHDGFDVKDFTVLDLALQNISAKVIEKRAFFDIVLVEFARKDYDHALQQIARQESGTQLLKDAYFLYLDAKIPLCYQRIRNRVQYSTPGDPGWNDNHFVSSKILRTYYREQNFSTELAKKFGTKSSHIKTILNNGSYQNFELYVSNFFKIVYRRESIFGVFRNSKQFILSGLRKLAHAFSASHVSSDALNDIEIKEATNV